MLRPNRGSRIVERQGAVFRSLRLTLLCCDDFGNLVDATDSALGRLGLTREILPTLRIDALVPELGPETWSATRETLRSGSTLRTDGTVQPWQGAPFRAEVGLQQICCDDGELVVLTVHELAPCQQPPVLERLACTAWEHLPDAVYWMRQDGSLVYVNPTACRMLGYSADEMLTKRMYELNPELSEQRWLAIWTALSEQRNRRFHAFHETRDGRTIAVEISASMVEVDGEQFSCALARDMTAHLAEEESHRREHAFMTSLIDTAPVMIVVLDAGGRVVRFNRTAEKISGYPLEEVVGVPWLDSLVHSPDRAVAERLFQQAMAGASVQGVACRIGTKAGLLREILWHHQLLSSTDIAELGLLLIGQDVTEQRQLEQDLRQSEKLQAIGRLAGGIAHDFNNQLAGIMGWAEILTWESQNHPALRECAERIMLASERARGLTSQLLAYSRKGPHVAQSVDLHDLVHEASSMLRRSIDKRVGLVLDLGAPDAHVQGDPAQLANAILNVALNARDAMPDGGSLTFATRLVARDAVSGIEELPASLYEDFVELTVTDTGCGMDEEALSHLFEPFYTTKQEGRGTGLGMAATYGAIKGHQGLISVQSTPDRGTRIRICLPHVAPGSISLLPAPAVAVQMPISLRVMLVDDEEAVREVTVRFLRQLKCEVVAFDNAFDAIDHFSGAETAVDVVLLDLIMPMLDGKSTFYALRRIDPEVPIILVSGYGLDGAAQSLIDEGALGFVAKPFTLRALSEALSRVPIGSAAVRPSVVR